MHFMFGDCFLKAFKFMTFLLIVAFVFHTFDNYQKCRTDFILELCKENEREKSHNQFCEQLCHANKIEFLKCHTVRHEKSVHEVLIDGRHMILKHIHGTQANIFNGELSFLSHFNSSIWLIDHYGNCKNVYAVEPVLQTAGQIFGNDDSLVDLLSLPDPLDGLIDFMSDQLCQLGLPKHVFSNVEVAVKDFMKQLFFKSPHNNPPFKVKMQFTRNLFEMLHDLVQSSNGSILLCDIHIDNFGLASNGRVKVIDADQIFFVETASNYLRTKECFDDNDCSLGDFSDCHSHCDQSAHTCSPNVALSNVVNICNVLLSLVFNEITAAELSVFKNTFDLMVNFSNTPASSLEQEMSRIKTIIRSFDEIDL